MAWVEIMAMRIQGGSIGNSSLIKQENWWKSGMFDIEH
jgi:hypothetical protein